MPTSLALEHGNLQAIHMPPTRFQGSTRMSIPPELVGVATPTVAAIPVNFADMLADAPRDSFPPSQFRGHFFFTKLGEQGADHFDHCLLQAFLHTHGSLLCALLPSVSQGEIVYSYC